MVPVLWVLLVNQFSAAPILGFGCGSLLRTPCPTPLDSLCAFLPRCCRDVEPVPIFSRDPLLFSPKLEGISSSATTPLLSTPSCFFKATFSVNPKASPRGLDFKRKSQNILPAALSFCPASCGTDLQCAWYLLEYGRRVGNRKYKENRSPSHNMIHWHTSMWLSMKVKL